jgi:lipopolysaccharide export system permease protein
MTAFILFTLLVTITDLISGLLRESVSPSQVIMNYWLQLPKWLAMILPFSCLCATLFGTERLNSKNELIAIFASGFGRKSFIITIALAALGVSIAEFSLTSIVSPLFNKKRQEWLERTGAKFENKSNMGLKTTLQGGNRIWYKNKDQFLAFTAFDKNSKEIKEPVIFTIGDDQKIAKIIWAKAAKSQIGRDWSFREGKKLEDLDKDSFALSSSFTELLLPLRETPREMSQIDSEVSNLGLVSLIHFISNIRRAGINAQEYEVLLYEKISAAILCLLLAMVPIGVLFAPGRRQSSFGKNAAFALLAIFIYYLLNSMMMALGTSGRLPPLLSVFLIPGLVAAYLAVILTKKSRTI